MCGSSSTDLAGTSRRRWIRVWVAQVGWALADLLVLLVAVFVLAAAAALALVAVGASDVVVLPAPLVSRYTVVWRDRLFVLRPRSVAAFVGVALERVVDRSGVGFVCCRVHLARVVLVVPCCLCWTVSAYLWR